MNKEYRFIDNNSYISIITILKPLNFPREEFIHFFLFFFHVGDQKSPTRSLTEPYAVISVRRDLPKTFIRN